MPGTAFVTLFVEVIWGLEWCYFSLERIYICFLWVPIATSNLGSHQCKCKDWDEPDWDEQGRGARNPCQSLSACFTFTPRVQAFQFQPRARRVHQGLPQASPAPLALWGCWDCHSASPSLITPGTARYWSHLPRPPAVEPPVLMCTCLQRFKIPGQTLLVNLYLENGLEDRDLTASLLLNCLTVLLKPERIVCYVQSAWHVSSRITFLATTTKFSSFPVRKWKLTETKLLVHVPQTEKEQNEILNAGSRVPKPPCLITTHIATHYDSCEKH